MKHFYILPPHYDADSFYRSSYNPTLRIIPKHSNPPLFIMKIQTTYEAPKFFYNMWNHFFIHQDLKQAFEERFRMLNFERIHMLAIEANMDRDLQSSYNRDSFWKVNIPLSGAVGDFYLWEGTHLVVSENAFNFLCDKQLFQEVKPEGGGYTSFSNKFEIENGNLKHFFTVALKEIQRTISASR